MQLQVRDVDATIAALKQAGGAVVSTGGTTGGAARTRRRHHEGGHRARSQQPVPRAAAGGRARRAAPAVMRSLATVVAAVAVVAASVAVQAQWIGYPTANVPRTRDGKPNLAAPAPRTADGKPDFSGVWESDGYTRGTEGTGAPPRTVFFDLAHALGGRPPYQPWAAALYDRRKEDQSKDNPDARCLPLGPLQMLAHPLPKKILQAPGLVVLLHERNMEFRQIYTDGRPRPQDPNPSWYGYSTARWEGDTLVVDTNGLRDGLWADFDGSPLTDQATIRERFRRPNFGTLQVDVTVDRPQGLHEAVHRGRQPAPGARHRPARIRLPRERKGRRPPRRQVGAAFRRPVLRSRPPRRIESGRDGMIRRFLGVIAAVGCGTLLWPAPAALAQAKGSADAAAAKRADPHWKAPRNAFGQPDLEGIWTTDDMRGVPTSRPAAVRHPRLHERRGIRQPRQAARHGARRRQRQNRHVPQRGRHALVQLHVDGHRAGRRTRAGHHAGGAGTPPARRPGIVRRRPVGQGAGLLALRSLHHPRHDRLVDAGRVRQRRAHHPDARLGGHRLRDGARHARHPARRPQAPRSGHQAVHGRLARRTTRATRW